MRGKIIASILVLSLVLSSCSSAEKPVGASVHASTAANILCGASGFSGKLPSPWYGSTEQIGSAEYWLEKGYGLQLY